jgi:hypothetical protein
LVARADNLEKMSHFTGMQVSDERTTTPGESPSAQALSVNNIVMTVCLYLDPYHLARMSEVSTIWRITANYAWSELGKHHMVNYLTYGRMPDKNGSKARAYAGAWPYPSLMNRADSNRGIVTVGGLFGTWEKVSTETFITSEQPSQDAKIAIAQLPHSLGAMAHCTDAYGSVRLMGGWSSSGQTAIDTTYFYEPQARPSFVLSPAKLPVARCYAAATSTNDGQLFYIGGGDTPYRGADVSKEVFVCPDPFNFYDAFMETRLSAFSVSDTSVANFSEGWKRIPDMAATRCGHCAVTTFDNHVVVLGGYHAGSIYLDSVEMFDLGMERWLSLSKMSCVKSGAVAQVGLHGEIYVFGGSKNGTEGISMSERLDLRVGKWEQLRSMHFERGYLGGCAGRGGQVYVSGGLHNDRFQSTMEIFDMRMGTWKLLDTSADSEVNKEISRALRRAGHTTFFCM